MTAPVPLTLVLAFCALASLGFSNAIPSYAPKTNQACPAILLRQPSPAPNSTLNPLEVQYLAQRRILLGDGWSEWVGSGGQLGYNVDKLDMGAHGYPVIGIALSGGGHRSVLFPSVLWVRAKTDCWLGLIAAQHKLVLVYFLLLTCAMIPPERRAQVDSYRSPAT